MAARIHIFKVSKNLEAKTLNFTKMAQLQTVPLCAPNSSGPCSRTTETI